MLRMTLWTTDSSETPLKPPASQELLNGAHDDGAQRSGARLEAFFVSPDVTVKVSLKQLVKPVRSGCLGLYGAEGSATIQAPTSSLRNKKPSAQTTIGCWGTNMAAGGPPAAEMPQEI